MNDFEKASLDDERYDGSDCENVLEWIKNDKRATISLTQGKMVSRVRKLAETHPEVEVVKDTGNSNLAHIPADWIRINPGTTLTEEQRQAKAEILKKARQHQRENDRNGLE